MSAAGQVAARALPGQPPSRLARRLPILALALVALLAGLWAGLLRLGFAIPPLRPALAADHGPLMVLGFLGTQISLERAVALRRRWPYLAPAAAGAGALWMLVGLPAAGGQALLAFSGLVLVAIFIYVHQLAASWHNAIMGLGALAWLVGAVVWLGGVQLPDVVPWLAGFIVLTIVGERLELSRMRRPPAHALRLLLVAVVVLLVGIAIATSGAAVGVRIAGIGLLAQALWLARYDVTRATIRIPGATRYMASALMAGYVWLAAAGVVWLINGAMAGYGFAYDAMVHAIFLGFAISMVFAHATVIIPAVLGVPLPYRRAMYIPLGLLHAGLVVRLVGGDAFGNLGLWQWGGVANEVSILLFLVLAVYISRTARKARAAGRQHRPLAAAPSTSTLQ